jgi:hypothetical protein
VAGAFPQLPTRQSVSPGFPGQETFQLVRVRIVSNHLFPNRAGSFQSTRLSRDVAPPVLGCCGIHRTRWVLSTLPCGPSPCPGHYPRHSATTTALLPYSSRRLGSPIVSRLCWSVLRCPFRWVPRSFRVAGGGSFSAYGIVTSRPLRMSSSTMLTWNESMNAQLGFEQSSPHHRRPS